MKTDNSCLLWQTSVTAKCTEEPDPELNLNWDHIIYAKTVIYDKILPALQFEPLNLKMIKHVYLGMCLL